MIRIVLPFHLRNLARVDGEVRIAAPDGAHALTIGKALDALEHAYPMLKGTIRDHSTLQRRPFIRYFACGRDWSLESSDATLPDAVVRGEEPLMIVGAIAGG